MDSKKLISLAFILFNLGFRSQLRVFSDLLERSEWKPNCPCSTCEDIFGKYNPKKPVKTAGKLKRSSSFERHSKPAKSTIARSASIEFKSPSAQPMRMATPIIQLNPLPARPVLVPSPYHFVYQQLFIPVTVHLPYVRLFP